MGQPNGVKLNKEKVLELIKFRNISQGKLAKMIGVSPQAVGQWLNGSRGVKADKLLKIAEVLNVDPSSIVEGNAVDYENMIQIRRDIIRSYRGGIERSPLLNLLESVGFELKGEYYNFGKNTDKDFSKTITNQAARIAEVSRVTGEYEYVPSARTDFANNIYRLRTPAGREIWIEADNFDEIAVMVADLAAVTFKNMAKSVDPPPEEWKIPASENE